ncbi:alanine racemase [Marinomonas mediterranea]|uniref:alanine racemase n=1 Tax=Marinomonas mediterranea TaxID=119864 RepID=UPI00234B3BCC|nr:alanine racemase [Marinomonas mediterranea]WCN07489.1 alanine racemase [Marinomonas mediterranea]
MFYRDTWVEVDLDRIAHNVSHIKEHSGYEHLFAVVKANAYGHGDVEVARAALDAGATHLAVAFLDEALSLRLAIKDVPILVMGPVRVEDISLAAEHKIHITVHDMDWIMQAAHYCGPTVNVHLKMDSGMHRIGLTSAATLALANSTLREYKHINLVGLFTHFATADSCKDYYSQQLKNVAEMTAGLDLNTFEYVHQSNSAALLYQTPQPNANCARLGIAMYGLAPNNEMSSPVSLKQAFSLHSRITQVKSILAGDKVGYGATFEAKTPMKIAVIPIGYADGWLRYHQNRSVSIKGKLYPIVGRICMDQSMILIDETITTGDQVDLINDQCTVDMAAKDLQTINYEIVCSISDRVPRRYLQGGVTVSERNDRFRHLSI